MIRLNFELELELEWWNGPCLGEGGSCINCDFDVIWNLYQSEASIFSIGLRKATF